MVLEMSPWQRISYTPLQFNYLSYELFWKKQPVRLQKKKKKVDFGVKVIDESGLEIFCQTQKKSF